ncbi:MAG: hypothetical protein IJ352_04970 [Muribaculaceae bacterium]|nr:hypothetical protein [Muribaculaceae bacterium]
MTINDRAFAYAQVGYVLVVLLALILMPGAHVITTLIAMVGVWFVVSGVYQAAPWRNREGWWTLLIAATILAVGIIANVHCFTVKAGATTELPLLNNPDSYRFHYNALYTMGYPEGIFVDAKNHGYGLIISTLWHITGVTIVAPLVLNMLVTLLSVLLCGGIAWRMLRGETSKSGRWIASCAMIMSASVCYSLNSGTLLLKEALLIFAFSLIGFSITSLVKMPTSRRRYVKMILMFASGTVILSFLRFNFLIMPIVGALILMKWQRKHLIMSSIMILICVLAWGITANIGYQSQSEMANVSVMLVKGEGIDNSFFLDDPHHTIYNGIVDGYLGYPWWKRLLYLPMSAAVQYLIPLPWGFGDDIHYGYTLAYAHISWPWYLVGGLILYYFISAMRRSPDILRRMTVWGALMWLVPAYMFAGTVSRYTLPLLPILIPSAVYVVATWRQHTSMRRWMWVYGILLAIALVVAYFVQQGGVE